MKLIPLRKAIECTGLWAKTLRKYADQGLVRSVRTPGGMRLYDETDLLSLGSENQSQKKQTQSVTASSAVASKETTLARQSPTSMDSSPKQKSSKTSARDSTTSGKVLEPYWNELCAQISSRLLLPHRDRLTRFGFELIEYLVCLNGGKILVGDQSTSSPEAELTADLLSIIHVFSCRIHGLRKYRNQIKKILIYLSADQRRLVRTWFGAARYVFNKTIELLRDGDVKRIGKLLKQIF